MMQTIDRFWHFRGGRGGRSDAPFQIPRRAGRRYVVPLSSNKLKGKSLRCFVNRKGRSEKAQYAIHATRLNGGQKRTNAASREILTPLSVFPYE